MQVKTKKPRNCTLKPNQIMVGENQQETASTENGTAKKIPSKRY